jgi:SAM-dependent methyltransferase
MKKILSSIKNVDIYLLDQAMKGRIPLQGRILDAGCGKGRNFGWLAEKRVDIHGFDPQGEVIEDLIAQFPDYADRLHVARIENFKADEGYDFIICNAVLHFAENHDAFHTQFAALTTLLKPSATLFVRMACTMGLDVTRDKDGRCTLPDLTERYLLDYEMIDTLCGTHNLALLEPVKAVWVNGERSMATLVFTRLD